MNPRMPVPLVHRGIRADAIEIPVSVDVPQPHAFGAFDHDVEWMVVVRAVLFVKRHIFARSIGNCVHLPTDAPRVFTPQPPSAVEGPSTFERHSAASLLRA